jgi:Cu(I)/Ag(I) efflux system membrane fusion protein
VLHETSGFMNAAKSKLLLGGLNEQQVNELEITKQAKITNTIYSKAAGTITEIALKEGDYVNEGTMIYKMADLSSLWVEAQLYTNELGYLEEGKKVEIVADAYPDERIDGIVIFVNPELQQQSKINLIRAAVNNSRMLFKPGMQAYVVLKSENKRSIVIPSDAVLKNAAENIVWVLHEKTAAPDLQFKFEPRTVTIGLQTKNKTEIISGLRQGDQVVVSGAYLLNSEYIFKRGAAPTEMKAKEMPGMKM